MKGRELRARALRGWPLWSALTAQVILTLPWIWRTAPFTDEALYLSAGHKEWAHWLHHASMPDYASYFSGAPVFYPPLGAAADSLGGLAAARGLSLLFMLAATIAVYFAGLQIFGRQTAFFAAALFAMSGLIVHNGAFATYNPLAILLLTLSMWGAARVRNHGAASLVLCICALVLANAAKYATLAWDPVIVVMVICCTWPSGAIKAFARGAVLTISVAAAEGGLLIWVGSHYAAGVEITTLFRPVVWGFSAPSAVVWRAFLVIGILLIPAVVGVGLSIWAVASPVILMPAVLVAAALIAPLDQARIHELSSLDKNMSFGLPFLAIATGYSVSALIDLGGERFPGGRAAGIVAGVALLLSVLVVGRAESVQFRGPSREVASKIVGAIRKNYHPGSYILTDNAPWMERYYLPDVPVRAWMAVLDPPAEQRARIRDRICSGHVSLVIMRLARRSYLRPDDAAIRRSMVMSGMYQLVTVTSQGKFSTQIWRRVPAVASAKNRDQRAALGCDPAPSIRRLPMRRRPSTVKGG